MHAKRQTEKGRKRGVLGMISIMGGPGRSMVTGIASASERERARAREMYYSVGERVGGENKPLY